MYKTNRSYLFPVRFVCDTGVIVIKHVKKSLYEQVYCSLKEMIIKGDYLPGEKLKEVRIAEQLKASRTPVREALRRLEREGLVVIHRGQGAVVPELSKQTVEQLFECRSVLEGLAAKKAALLIKESQLNLLEENLILAREFFLNQYTEKVVLKNTEFHDTITQASQNDSLMRMMEQIRTQIVRYRILHGNIGFRPAFIDEHEAIFQAIKRKDAELAENLMKEHCLNDCKFFISVI